MERTLVNYESEDYQNYHYMGIPKAGVLNSDKYVLSMVRRFSVAVVESGLRTRATRDVAERAHLRAKRRIVNLSMVSQHMRKLAGFLACVINSDSECTGTSGPCQNRNFPSALPRRANLAHALARRTGQTMSHLVEQALEHYDRELRQKNHGHPIDAVWDLACEDRQGVKAGTTGEHGELYDEAGLPR